MRRDDDRRKRRIKDYRYYRNKDLGRKDAAQKTARELERLHLKLGGGRRPVIDNPDDEQAETSLEVT